MQPSTGYTLGFAASICVFCSIFVAGAAVALKDRQDANKVLDRQKKVLSVAGLDCVDDMSPEQIGAAFEKVEPILVDMEASPPAPVDPSSVGAEYGVAELGDYDPRKAAKDPALQVEDVEANAAKVTKMPRYEVVYRFKFVKEEDNPCSSGELPNQLIVPIQGPGLWSTLYGYVSLTGSGYNTVNGLIFYEHAETPGLGGEVDNPKWKAQWKSKKVRKADEGEGPIVLSVVKGMAKDEYGVDGLSGATITSNGVTEALRFWLGKGRFEPATLDKISSFTGSGG